jgi:hypothetical protein
MADDNSSTSRPSGRWDGGSPKAIGILPAKPSKPQGDDGYTEIGKGSAYDRGGLAARGKTVPNRPGSRGK